MTELFIYYVYAYLRPDGSPYYIGKGKNWRAFSKQHSIAVPKDKSRIVFLETNLSNIGAFALERRYIAWYGRKDNNTGILRNRTDGGEGLRPTDEIRLKMKLAQQKRRHKQKDKILKTVTPAVSESTTFDVLLSIYNDTITMYNNKIIEVLFNKIFFRPMCILCLTHT